MDMFLSCISFTLIAIASALFDDPRSRCPQVLARNNYLLPYLNESVCIQLNHDEHSWDDSRRLCRHNGGDLVVIKNQLKQTFIENALKQAHWNLNGIWIGGTDRDREGDWQWVTGERMTWSNWDRGEGPSHSGFLFSRASWEDCAMIRRDKMNKWHDYSCDGLGIRYSSICEYKMVPITTVKSVPSATFSPFHTRPKMTTNASASNNLFTTRTAQTRTTTKASTAVARNTRPFQSTTLSPTKNILTSKLQTSATTRKPITTSQTLLTTHRPSTSTIKSTTSTSPTKTTVIPTSKPAAVMTVQLTTKTATTKATTAKLRTTSMVMTTYKKPQSTATKTNNSPTSKPSSTSVTLGTKTTQIATRKSATVNPKDTNSPGTRNKLVHENGKPLKETSYTGYIIGAAVAAVVVAGMLVTIIVFKRKRNANSVSNLGGFTGDNPTYDIMFGKDPSLYADVETNEIYVPNNVKLVFGESCS